MNTSHQSSRPEVKSALIYPGRDAVQSKGWLRAHKWVVFRRISQLSVLALFMLGPVAGVRILKGNLSSSQVLETVPLADPFVLVQTVVSGHIPELTVLLGAVIVLAVYGVLGGRVFCSWVCPVNPITDFASYLRRKLGIKKSSRLNKSMRWYLLAVAWLAPLLTGRVVWELVNPVSMVHRGILFGMGWGWSLILAVFLFDLFVSRRGWCGHICPMGACYSLIGKSSVVRVSAAKRENCNDCMDCFAVCPEPQVIKPALKGQKAGIGPVILASDCTNCGRCIDVCAQDVFQFGTRFANKAEK
jgi:ferredoxin-type protein NapH